MPGGFVGRFTELDRLSALLGRVGDPARDLPGVAVTLRGRQEGRKVAAGRGLLRAGGSALRLLPGEPGYVGPLRAGPGSRRRLAGPTFGKDLFSEGTVLPDWSAFFRQLAAAVPADRRSVVVIDELPWLLESRSGSGRRVADRVGSGALPKPVLLILIGSDLAMMEQLDDYRRPFHQRATVMVLPP